MKCATEGREKKILTHIFIKIKPTLHGRYIYLFEKETENGKIIGKVICLQQNDGIEIVI